MMWGWGAGWWWLVGAGFMVICMVMMGRMMGHGHSGHGGHGPSGDPERTLADRLARGEIDVEEYNRRLEAFRRTDHARDRKEAANSRPAKLNNSLEGR